MAQKPVLISGAGLASLLLARSLLRSNVPFRIFERDASLAFRGQGYRLRLSNEGLDAIQSTLDGPSWEKFYATCSKTGGSGFTAFNAITGEPLEENAPAIGTASSSGGSGNDNSGPPPSASDSTSSTTKTSFARGPTRENLFSRDKKTVGIARGEMRSLFMEGCEEFVHWGKHVSSYKLTPSGDGVYAIFSDGTRSEEGCLLVGGEGIKSQVAKQVSGGELKVWDLGARGIHGQAPSTAFQALGEGVFRIVDDSRPDCRVSVITNVRPGDMDDPQVQFGWTMVGSPGAIKAPNDDYSIVGQQVAGLAKELTSKWHERFRPLFEQIVVEEAAFWKITCSNPEGPPVWRSEERVTVIGDAVHSMTPAGGLGANTAVRDSALLGRLLHEAGGWAPGITKRYEDEMRVYAKEAVGQSYGMATSQFRGKITEDTPTV